MKTLYPQWKVWSQHLCFREDLADKLIDIGLYEGGYMHGSSSEPLATPPSPLRPTTSSTPSTHSRNRPPPQPVVFPPPSSHLYEQRPTRSRFLLCRWKSKADKGVKIRSISFGCRESNYPLCRDCFVEFHAMAGTIGSG